MSEIQICLYILAVYETNVITNNIGLHVSIKYAKLKYKCTVGGKGLHVLKINMNILETENNIVLEGVEDFSLPDILDCGQCFTFNSIENPDFTTTECYEGVAMGKYLLISRSADGIVTLHNVSRQEFEEIWRPYFDLDTDYAQIKTLLSQDDVMRRAAEFAPGIRVLRQDGWEALCCFIISQNNNVKRIKGIVSRLCETFGKPLEHGFYSFPTPQDLSGITVESLAPLRCGFRAKYLVDAVEQVCSGTVLLDQLLELPIDEARAELQKIYGVGPKVSDCALLFGFYRIECCPMDVWMKRVMSELFPSGMPEYALPYAGIAQQYLFHYARTGSALAAVN